MWPKRKRPQERECLPTAFQLTRERLDLGTSTLRPSAHGWRPDGMSRRPLKRQLWHGAYFARFHTSTAGGPPTDGAVFVYFSSSPATVKFVRFCSVPFQFGNELYSTRRTRSDPLTEYVPKYEMVPPMIALYSSGVPLVRLFDAYLGRSGRINMRE